MKLGTLDRDGFLRLFLRMQGTGYSADPDSNRVKELTAVAEIAAKVSESLEAAAGNLLLSTAVTLLDKLEDVRFLTQGSTRSTSARQSRLVAHLRALPMMPTRLGNAFAGHVGVATGATLQPTRAQLQAHRASPLGAFGVGRREPAATDPLIRADLALIMQRGLPARCLFLGISTRDATWGDALEPASLKLQPAVTVPAQTKARTAPIEMIPGRVVMPFEWIEIQSMLCWKSHGFSLDQHAQGRTIFASASLSSGGTSIDGSVDWSNRFLQVWGVVGAVGSVDDPTTLDATKHSWLPPSKLGAAGAGFTHTLFDTQDAPDTASQSITFAVNGSGQLVITNNGGGTVSVRLFVRGSPQYIPGTSADTQPWINNTQVASADLCELYAATVVSDVDDEGQFAGVDAGALRRVIYTGPMLREAGQGIPQLRVLDTSEDWRNRWVLVTCLQTYNGVTSGAENNHFTIGTFGMFPSGASRPNAPRLFFTGAGQAPGSSSVLPNQHACTTGPYDPRQGDADNAWLFARASDGALVIEMKDPTSNYQCYSGLLLLTATEQTTGASVVTPVPVHATQVQTIDLDQPQNTGCYAQGRQGNVPRYLLTDPAPKARPTCPAMGLISEGNSPVRPSKWETREMLGAADDGTWERRQPLVGQRKRLVSVACLANSTTPVDDFNLPQKMAPGLNDQVDFRDRFLWVEGTYSASDITITNASQQSDTSASAFEGILYAGPYCGYQEIEFGGQALTGIFLQFEFTRRGAGRGYHSRLLVRNTTGATVYVNMAIEASGFLGFTDRRSIGY